jgi:transcriptional regulator with XRE-family HTH domain
MPAGAKINSDGVALAFGQNLRRCRQLSGLSQEDLAARASLHRTEVTKLEKGDRVARIDTLIRLAGAMAIRPEDLIVGIYWTPREPGSGGFSFGTPRSSRVD